MDFRSTIGSLSIISKPSGKLVGIDGRGTSTCTTSSPPKGIARSLPSSLSNSFPFSTLTFSLNHIPTRFRTFSTPSKTATSSSFHSTPEVELIKVRKTEANKEESTPKLPIYFERSWSCGGEDIGYDEGRETRIRREVSSKGGSRLKRG
jgi:hypothetical protein